MQSSEMLVENGLSQEAQTKNKTDFELDHLCVTLEEAVQWRQERAAESEIARSTLRWARWAVLVAIVGALAVFVSVPKHVPADTAHAEGTPIGATIAIDRASK